MMAASVSFAQHVEFDGGKTHTYVMGHSGPTDCYLIFHNYLGKSADFVYNKIQDDYPKQWWVSFCDNVNCYASLIQSDTFATLKDSAEAEFKITVTPNGHADTSTVQYEFYEASNPNVKDTLTFVFIVQWGAGTQDLVSGTYRVFPNPVTDQLHIPFAKSGSEISIYNETGSVVRKFQANASAVYSASDLMSGVYFVSYLSNGVPVRLRFIKN